jgi:hypothetical protein
MNKKTAFTVSQKSPRKMVLRTVFNAINVLFAENNSGAASA